MYDILLTLIYRAWPPFSLHLDALSHRFESAVHHDIPCSSIPETYRALPLLFFFFIASCWSLGSFLLYHKKKYISILAIDLLQPTSPIASAPSWGGWAGSRLELVESTHFMELCWAFKLQETFFPLNPLVGLLRAFHIHAGLRVTWGLGDALSTKHAGQREQKPLTFI